MCILPVQAERYKVFGAGVERSVDAFLLAAGGVLLIFLDGFVQPLTGGLIGWGAVVLAR